MNNYIPYLFSILIFIFLFISMYFYMPKSVKNDRVLYVGLLFAIVVISLNLSSLISGSFFIELKNRHGRICLPPVGDKDSVGYKIALKSQINCLNK